MLKKKIILVDFDGVLSEGECWTAEECKKVKPITKNIEKVNKLSKNNFIVVWTARNDDLIVESLKWLRRNGVEFDAISNEKPPANFYIDDKAISLDDLI